MTPAPARISTQRTPTATIYPGHGCGAAGATYLSLPLLARHALRPRVDETVPARDRPERALAMQEHLPRVAGRAPARRR